MARQPLEDLGGVAEGDEHRRAAGQQPHERPGGRNQQRAESDQAAHNSHEDAGAGAVGGGGGAAATAGAHAVGSSTSAPAPSASPSGPTTGSPVPPACSAV